MNFNRNKGEFSEQIHCSFPKS